MTAIYPIGAALEHLLLKSACQSAPEKLSKEDDLITAVVTVPLKCCTVVSFARRGIAC